MECYTESTYRCVSEMTGNTLSEAKLGDEIGLIAVKIPYANGKGEFDAVFTEESATELANNLLKAVADSKRMWDARDKENT